MKGKSHAVTCLTYILILSLFLMVIWGADEAVTTLAQRIPLERNATIVIDPGHGGPDGGATSCTGILESKMNLEISLTLNDLLHLLGYQTRMIRTTDVSVYTSGDTIAAKKVSDLRQRVRIVNETDNAVLLSIHQNTFTDHRYAGAQVFYSTAGQSRELAEGLQSQFNQTLNPGSNRMAKQADGIYLMQHIQKTGILIECGFLSNPEEEAKLRNTDYQKKICSVIGTTVARFLTE